MARRRLPAPGEKHLAILRCELRWYVQRGLQRLSSLRNRARRKLHLESGDPRELKNLQRQSNERLIRRLLRSSPWWVDGHLRLGFLAVQSQLEAESGRDPRSLQVIRVAGQAAGRLTAGTAEDDGARGSELRLLLAMEQFLRREFTEALRLLEPLLEPARAAQLPLHRYHLALEHAAAAALALGDDEKARTIYSTIPIRARSADAAIAITYLANRPS